LIFTRASTDPSAFVTGLCFVECIVAAYKDTPHLITPVDYL